MTSEQTNQYIDTPQIKQLLKKLPLLKALLGNLRAELKLVIIKGRGIVGTDEQVMYAMAMASQVLNDMPRTESAPGDKATRIIATYGEIVDLQYQEIKQELTNEIIIISSVIDKTQRALDGIKEDSKKVLTTRYVANKPWSQVADGLCVSAIYARRILTVQALDEMQIALRVSVEDYKFCMEKVEKE